MLAGIKQTLKTQLYGWLLVLPFVLSLLVFFVFALLRTIGYSFSEYDLFSAPSWVGLDNYLALFRDPLFFRAAANTLAFSCIVTLVQTVLALLLAVIVNGPIRAKGVFRTVYYLPSIMSSAAITLIFVWVYQKNGFLNAFLSGLASHKLYLLCFVAAFVIAQVAFIASHRLRGIAIGLFDPLAALVSAAIAWFVVVIAAQWQWIAPTPTVFATPWLGTREMVGPMPLTLWAIVLQNIFTTVPTLMLLFLAGLQGIPADLYEAAAIDGANKWQQLWHITVPHLAPVTFVVVTMGIIGTLQMFDQVALLGGGVPLESRITLAYYVYHYAFPDGTSPQIGIASAAALMLGLLTIAIVIVQKRFGVKEQQHGDT